MKVRLNRRGSAKKRARGPCGETASCKRLTVTAAAFLHRTDLGEHAAAHSATHRLHRGEQR